MKKLQLKKEIVARLDDDQMSRMKGGAVNPAQTAILCETENVAQCPQELQSKGVVVFGGAVLIPFSCECPVRVLVRNPTDICAI